MPRSWLRLPWQREPLLAEPGLVIQLEGRAERLAEFATWLKRVEGALGSRDWVRKVMEGPEAELLSRVSERWDEAAQTLAEARRRSLSSEKPARGLVRWLDTVEVRMRAVEARAHELCGSGGSGPAREVLSAVAMHAVRMTWAGDSGRPHSAPSAKAAPAPGVKPLEPLRKDDIGCVVGVLLLASPLAFFAVGLSWAWVVTNSRAIQRLGDGFNIGFILLATAAVLVGMGWAALELNRRR